jgi:hypothetical protein
LQEAVVVKHLNLLVSIRGANFLSKNNGFFADSKATLLLRSCWYICKSGNILETYHSPRVPFYEFTSKVLSSAPSKLLDRSVLRWHQPETYLLY